MVDLPRLLTRHTELLLATARSLQDTQGASLCPGWSRGHVLTHLARNADGLGALVRAAVDHTGESMYRTEASRDADIEAGSRRPLPELVDDVEASARALSIALPRLSTVANHTRVERTPAGQSFLVGALPMMRLREVVYHHVDLDAGFGFADVEPSLVEVFLSDEYTRLGPDGARQAKAADLLWRARGIREDTP